MKKAGRCCRASSSATTRGRPPGSKTTSAPTSATSPKHSGRVRNVPCVVSSTRGRCTASSRCSPSSSTGTRRCSASCARSSGSRISIPSCSSCGSPAGTARRGTVASGTRGAQSAPCSRSCTSLRWRRCAARSMSPPNSGPDRDSSTSTSTSARARR